MNSEKEHYVVKSKRILFSSIFFPYSEKEHYVVKSKPYRIGYFIDRLILKKNIML